MSKRTDVWGLASALVVIGFLFLFLMVLWWMMGAILSITLGDLLIYAIMFGIGYAIGSNK